MRVLLINPPIEDFFFTPQRSYPLGILYLATVLDKEGFTVKVLNALEEPKKVTLKVPQKFAYLKKYYQPNKSPFCLFLHYSHFGLSYADIEEQIKAFKPEVVGVSSNFSAYFDCALKLAQRVKRIDKNMSVVFGGRVSSAMPEFVLKHKSIDFVIRGEAEFSFLELCRKILEGKLPQAEGLCYKLKNKIHIAANPALIRDLNCLAFPNRMLINYARYKFKGLISTSLLASRGCNLHCQFCAISEKLRWRSANNVLEEMEECFGLGIRHFNFEDDNINLNPELPRLLDLMIEKFCGKIKISFMNGLLAYGLTKNLRQKLLGAGLTHIDLSMISTKSSLRQQAQRKDAIKNIVAVSDFMARKKIAPTVHFIVSLPDQKWRDSLADLKFLAKKRVFLGPSIFYPVIESGYFRQLTQKFQIKTSDYAFFRSSAAYFDRFMLRDEIFSIFYFCRIVNFIKMLIDEFSLNNSNFGSFIRQRVQKFNPLRRNISASGRKPRTCHLRRRVRGDFTLRNNILVSMHKVTRFELGVIILARLLKENKVFRVEQYVKSRQFYYVFKEEAFISAGRLKKVISGLYVRGVFSNAVIKLKAKP